MSNFNCQSKSFISIFFICQVSACELRPFSCYNLANDIYSQTAKTVFSHLKWPVHDLVIMTPPPPLIKVARNTRPCSKLGGTTLNGREEGGQYYISQTCNQERFEARKVVFSWKCLDIFATGCSFWVWEPCPALAMKSIVSSLLT